MNSVSAVERRNEKIGVGRIADDLVEINHIVERGFRADPLVDLITNPCLVRIPAGVGAGRRDVVAGDDRGADDPDALSP